MKITRQKDGYKIEGVVVRCLRDAMLIKMEQIEFNLFGAMGSANVLLMSCEG